MFSKFLKPYYYIQSEESRAAAINRFCWLIVLLAAVYAGLFVAFGIYKVALLLTLVAIAFRYFVFLNKRAYQKTVAAAIILSTNLGVVLFSLLLGFDSGVYLYFFVAPMLIYLIFDFSQKQAIYGSLLLYLFTFLFISFCHHLKVVAPMEIKDSFVEMIYTANFVFSFLICFSLLIYFSNSNQAYFNELALSNRDKDVLLSEVHHRVKNNLAVISGLIELQSSYVADVNAHGRLKDSVRRIKAIGLLHEKLYNSKDYQKVELGAYIHDVISYLKNVFPDKADSVKFELIIDPVELVIREALPLSLVLNELITNALKYAFNGAAQGTIRVTISNQHGSVRVKVEDNGAGFKLNDELRETSLGINLIFSLSEALGGKAELHSDMTGTVYTMEFEPEKFNLI